MVIGCQIGETVSGAATTLLYGLRPPDVVIVRQASPMVRESVDQLYYPQRLATGGVVR